jgi:Zn2+/Cd2+-exporting ATPase
MKSCDITKNETAEQGNGKSCCGSACHTGHTDGCGPQAAGGSTAFSSTGPPPEGVSITRYRIDSMDCPVEEQLIRKRLEPMPGVARLDFNLFARQLTVYHRLYDTRPVAAALESIGMPPVLIEDGVAAPATSAMESKSRLLLVLGGIAAVSAETVSWVSGQEDSWPVMLMAAVSILTAGLPTLKKGWIALRHLSLNIYFLMSLAVIGAVAIGKWPEAAMVVFLFAIAEAIEALSLERVRNSIKSLAAMVPETAEVKSGSQWLQQPLTEVAVGSRIRIRTGSRVPLDARVVAGSAALDQAPITGESLPVDKRADDLLFAGSIVTDGVLEAIVTSAPGHSTLDRIAAAIQQAQAERAPTQRLVDRFAGYYTPAVVSFAAALALCGPLLVGGSWSSWLYQALVILVIACPCALVLSTPVTVVSGLTAAARHGILIKGGAYLENGRLLKAVALDKTGTLTLGRPAMNESVALDSLPLDYLLLISASLDDHSNHPVARAIVAGWKKQQPAGSLLPVDNFSVLNGHGVKGDINGQTWYLGNHRLVEDLGVCTPALESRLVALENSGNSTVILCSASGPVALFGVADTLRPESGQAVTALNSLGVKPVMLSGDNSATARAIADLIGIGDARGNLMPESKLEAIVELKARYGMVGMVGDGINDAPALARADIGFAMGAAGTATALETADVAIMDDDPRKIAAFIGLSRNCAVILKQNISFAIAIKFIFLALALAGHATLWMAVFADMGASLLVVFNGLRLLGYFSNIKTT